MNAMTLALILASSAVLQEPEGTCYTVKRAGDDKPYISGDPLKEVPGEQDETKAKQRAGVEAAIALIAAMQNDSGCAMKSPQEFSGEGLTTEPYTSSLQLSMLMSEGRICVDTSRKEYQKKWKAVLARPTGTLEAPYSGEGFPAINIRPDQFPSCDPETGELDPGEVAQLASLLLHELYHTVYPGEPGTSAGEREGPAFTYEGAMIVQMLCCAGITPEQTSALCEKLNGSEDMVGVNQHLASLDLPQFETDKCGGGEEESNLVQGLAFPVPERRSFGYSAVVPTGVANGTIVMDYEARTVSFKIKGAFTIDHSVDLGSEVNPSLINFQPVSADFDATNPSPKRLLLFGYDTVSLQGQIVKVEFDNANGGEFLVSHLLYTDGFDNPIDAWISPFGGNKALVISQGNSPKFIVVSLLTGQADILLDATSDSRMYAAKFIRFVHVSAADPVTGEKHLRVAIGAVDAPSFASDIQEIAFYDFDLDGQFDLIE